MMKEEADYFGDIVIIPFMDRYELVVLKTIAICEFGVRPWIYHLMFSQCFFFFFICYFYLNFCIMKIHSVQVLSSKPSFYSLWLIAKLQHLNAGSECVGCIHHEGWWRHVYQGGHCFERDRGNFSQKVPLYG